MARLINADKRIAEIKKLYCDGCDNYGGVKCRACWVDDAICLIDDAPTADAVEVVRCKDCAYCHPVEDLNYCDNPNAPWIDDPDFSEITVSESDFCSYGERKDGGKAYGKAD